MKDSTTLAEAASNGRKECVADVSYGEAESLPVGVHATHAWAKSPSRGWHCLGCEALASWPIAKAHCPNRYAPVTSISKQKRALIRTQLEEGKKPADVAKALRCHIDTVQAIGRAAKKRNARERARRRPNQAQRENGGS